MAAVAAAAAAADLLAEPRCRKREKNVWKFLFSDERKQLFSASSSFVSQRTKVSQVEKEREKAGAAFD